MPGSIDGYSWTMTMSETCEASVSERYRFSTSTSLKRPLARRRLATCGSVSAVTLLAKGDAGQLDDLGIRRRVIAVDADFRDVLDACSRSEAAVCARLRVCVSRVEGRTRT